MAISLVGTTGSALNNTQDITLTMPSGISAGDFVVAGCCVGAVTDEDLTISDSGWTEIADLYADDEGTDTNLAVFYKRMGTVPDSTVTFPHPLSDALHGMAAGLMAYSGVDRSTALDATPTTATGKDSGIPDNPSITTVTDNAVVIAVAGNQRADAVVTSPSGYGNQVAYAINETVAGTSFYMADKTVATAGAEDPAAWTDVSTSSASSWAACTVALRPQADIAPAVFAHHYLRMAA